MNKQKLTLVVIPVVLIILGGGLRFFKINYGLPNFYFTDEEFFVQPALRVADGSANPGWFGAPAQTLIYGSAGAFRIVNTVVNHAHGTHLTPSVNYQHNSTPFQTAARAIPALAGTFMIWLVWLIGRRISLGTGVVAAGLVSLSFYLVDHSHIIRPDILQTTFDLAALYAMVRWKETGLTRWAVWVGIFYGLSITTKYPALFFLPSILVAAWYGAQRQWWTWRQWRIAALVGVATLVISGPYIFLHPIIAAHDLYYEGTADHGVHSYLGFFGNLGAFGQALDYQLGTGLIILTAVIGGWWAWSVRRAGNLTSSARFTLAIAASMVWYLIVLSLLRSNWDRWAIPAVVGFDLVIAAAITWAWGRRKWRAALVVALVLASLGLGLRLARTLWGYNHSHTADVTRAWVTDHLPVGSGIVLEPRSPVLPNQFRQLSLPNIAQRTKAQYRAGQWEYAILNDGIYGRLLNAPLSDLHNGQSRLHLAYTSYLDGARLRQRIDPSPDGTTVNLLEANDMTVLRSWSVRLMRGPTFWVYQFAWAE